MAASGRFYKGQLYHFTLYTYQRSAAVIKIHITAFILS
jgi:hypothetical protein